MGYQSNIEKLKDTPVTELNLGSASIKRAIKHAGFDTFPELLDLSEKQIDDIFDWENADTIIGFQEQYHANPEQFASSVLREREIDKEAVDRTISKARVSYEAQQKPRARSATRNQYSEFAPATLPPEPFSDVLKNFESRAKETFDDLDDKFENVMIYQTFEEFSTDLDELRDAFAQLFKRYSSQPRAALGLIDAHLPNAFMVYVADRARLVYSDGNLWGNFFNGLDGFDDNIQGDFKQLFAKHVKRRRMPLYAKDEETNYYFYTALLHGGLSADSWSNLWESCILPLSKEIVAGKRGFGGEMDGRSILDVLKKAEGRFAPKKAVFNILEKAPDSTIAPLFEAAMRVAVQIEHSKNAREGYTMISNYGLPEAAMEALRENQEQAVTNATKSHSVNSTREKRQNRRLVYLPMASLQLDLAEGVVTAQWPRQQFPLHFSEYKIDYYIDGKKRLSSKFTVSVGKCILEAARIPVEPQVRYDVELKLMQKDEQTQRYTEVSSLNQTFTKSKPGCFEFIKNNKGLYHLRNRNERITKKRRIAYIVKDGYRIEPGKGMTAVSEHETSGNWGDAQIFIYDVEPGSAGSIISTLTNEEIAVWQERYAAKIDKKRIIGETVDGLDLYGYAPCSLGTNGGLPSVAIEAFDGTSALDDLDIICRCDGQKVAIPRRIMWADDSGESNAAQIELILRESSNFDSHIEECLIEARQKSAGNKVVFRYRFAVVPIQDFRPYSIRFDQGVAIAEYGFQAVLAIDVTEAQGERSSINAWERYSAKTLLKDEFLLLRIRSQENGKKTDAKLALAAIDVEIPNGLAHISAKHSICLADALEAGPGAANFKITSYGWRYNRAALVMLGPYALFLKELKQPGEYEFNLFRHTEYFLQSNNRNNSTPRNFPLKLSVIYGDNVTEDYLKPAWTDTVLLNCTEGIGINDLRLTTIGPGKHVFRFDGQLLCDACFEFKRRLTGKILAKTSAEKGSTELVIPSNIVRLLDARKEIIVEVSPCDWFDNPQQEYTTRYIVKR